MSRTSAVERPAARSGFCNPSFVFGVGNGSHDDSHARCAKDDCPCPHHLDPGWRMTPAQRKNAEALSEQLKMPVIVDDTLPPETFIIGAHGLGVRMWDTQRQAMADWLAPHAEDLAAGRLVVEQVEPLTIQQADEDQETNHVRFVATETIRLRIPNPAELASRLVKVQVTE